MSTSTHHRARAEMRATCRMLAGHSGLLWPLRSSVAAGSNQGSARKYSPSLSMAPASSDASLVSSGHPEWVSGALSGASKMVCRLLSPLWGHPARGRTLLYKALLVTPPPHLPLLSVVFLPPVQCFSLARDNGFPLSFLWRKVGRAPRAYR